MSKNVLITGSSRGIGLKIAEVLSQKYNVFITSRNGEKLKELAQKFDFKGYFPCDLTQDSSVSDLINNAEKQIGNVDILINNAGEYVYSAVDKTSDDDLKRMLKLNCEVPYKLIKNVVPQMKLNKWGRIINIGSISGVVGEGNASLYSMTKSSFQGLTKALALELAEFGITVNTINPGWVETELAENAVEESDFSNDDIIQMIPQRRFIEPVEIANLVKYLVSDEAKGLTGQSISLCAGLSVG